MRKKKVDVFWLRLYTMEGVARFFFKPEKLFIKKGR
jgi:hypothetical protein